MTDKYEKNLEFLFRFFMLGYDYAMIVLKNSRSLVKAEHLKSMGEYFMEKAEKELEAKP